MGNDSRPRQFYFSTAASIMVVKYSPLRPIPWFLLPFSQTTRTTQARCLHQRVKAKPIPKPTPFVPNSGTFLTLIGRNLSQHASKIPSWRALFSLTSAQLNWVSSLHAAGGIYYGGVRSSGPGSTALEGTQSSSRMVSRRFEWQRFQCRSQMLQQHH